MRTAASELWAIMAAVALALSLHPLVACHALSSSSTSFARPLQIIYDSSNGLHRDINYHPECPDRIDHCLDAVRRHFSSEVVDNIGAPASHLIDVAARPIDSLGSELEYSLPLTKPELEHAENVLSRIHEPSYIASLQSKCEVSRQRRIDEGKDALGWIGYIDGSDTYVTTESYNVGVRATGAWIRATDAALGHHTTASKIVNDKPTEPPRTSIALTRPPGHHATYGLPNGFCLLNFAMAAAAHALSINPSTKISILDWDVHFGQGLMDILEKCSNDKGAENDWTSNIRYVSMHQVPCFPYEGQSREVRGRYNNVMTVPVHPESTWRCGYRELFTAHVLPFVSSRDEWEPDLVIVCAGYDALDSDELASMNLVASDYGEMTQLLRERISHSSGKAPALVFGLEGGYQLRDGVVGGNLSDALIETIKALLV